MAQICSCDGNIENLGKPSCLEGLDAALYPIFVQRTKADGTDNCIDVANDTLNAALFDGFFKNETTQNRWLPLTGIKNYVAEPGDAITESFEDGTFVLLDDGAIQVTFIVPCDDPYKLKSKVDALRCLKTGFYLVDRSGNLIGQEEGDNLCSRKIQDNSISTKVMPKNDSQTNKLEVTFVIDKTSNDRKVDWIASDDITGYDLTTTSGLLDVSATLTANSTTELVSVMTLDWGAKSGRTAAGGLTVSEIEVYNETTSSAVTPSSIVESPVGTYTITMAAQTSADVVHVRGVGGNTVQLSYDLRDVDDVTATIP